LAAVSTPAFAGQCDATPPAEPVVPTSAQILAMSVPDAQAKLSAMYKDIHVFQAQTKDYRACLDAAMDADKTKQASMKDGADKQAVIAEFSQYEKAYNDSVESETRVANGANAAAQAHCSRDTSDFCHPKH